jgi:acyl-coenzyme A thioesterase PaaI-like protein
LRKKIILKYLKLVNFWIPFLGSGIKIKRVNEERTRFDVTLRLTGRNKNLFGTQFGGSLYAMTDPFYAFILVLNLGDDYIVWDKSAEIKFIKPGKTKVFATLEIDNQTIENIKNEVDRIGKNTYVFTTNITDVNDEIIATVKKELYVRNKNFKNE